MVTRETRDGFELANGVDIVVATNDFRSIRGRAVLLAILDECAFYRDERSSSPDTELYNAITPGMLTLRDQAMLIGISTPHTKSGLLWNKYREKYGIDDPDVLVVKATSMQLNPTLPVEAIEAEIATDPGPKRAEYLCEWREDISGFVSSEIVERNRIEMALGCGLILMPSIPLILGIGTIVVSNPTTPIVLALETLVAFWAGAVLLFGGLVKFPWMRKALATIQNRIRTALKSN
jgi:hypothetical protein